MAADKLKVLVTDAIDPEGLKPLQSHPEIDLRFEVGPTPEKLEKALEGVGAWLVRSETKVTKDWIAKAKALRLIGRAGVGVDNIDVPAATLRGIAVVNAPAANTIAACEHAFGLLLAVARHIPQADADVKAGRWQRSKWMGAELQGKILGIIGFGRIGREVARRAQAFGMKLLAHDPFVAAEQAREFGAELADLKDLLSRSDFVTLHAPASDKTKKLLNAETLRWMKPGARLVNCARGELVDEAALAAALKAGAIAAAALDVFDKEPLPAGSPLRGLPNVILTPHLGASTQEAQNKVAIELSQSVIAFHERGIAFNALNLPGFDPETLKTLGDWLDLSETLGRFLAQTVDAGLRELRCDFAGEFKPSQRRPLSVAALKGFLGATLAQGATYVSAPAIANERGIKTSDSADPRAHGYQRLLTVTAATDEGPVSVAGTLLSHGEPRIVRFNDLGIEVLPRGRMIVLLNQDAPGVIGRVGTALGQAGINIADMRVGRRSPHGQAVMVLTVDESVTAQVLDSLKRLQGVVQARGVTL